MIHITTLMNMTPNPSKDLKTQHGLSFLIDYDGTSILFDTGFNSDFIENAINMGADLSRLSAVVLSHGHYDHTAGYKDLMKAGLAPRYLFVGKNFFEKKYIKHGMRYVNVSSSLDEVEIRNHDIDLRIIEKGIHYEKGIYFVTGFTESNPYEKVSKDDLILKDNGFINDDFSDEVCIVLETSKGQVILTGSSHIGLCNILDKVHRVFNKPIYAVIGGFPVDSKNEMRTKFTLSTLKEYQVKHLGYSPTKPLNNDEFKFNTISINTISVGDELFIN